MYEISDALPLRPRDRLFPPDRLVEAAIRRLVEYTVESLALVAIGTL